MLVLIAAAALAADPLPDVHVQATAEFLPDTVAQHVLVRAESEKDSYAEGEVRYAPDHSWYGRMGAGLDLCGGTSSDLRFGGFLGGMGTWDDHKVYLATRPQAGMEMLFGLQGDRFGAHYRWLIGFGGGALDRLMTENQLTLNFRVFKQVHLVGEYIRLNPGDRTRRETATGLGAEIVL